jgi:hypothetical protein
MLPTLEEMLNPIEERQVDGGSYTFEGGEKEIVQTVCHELATDGG